ncbi:TPA: hypothetical protein ACH3X1_012696 [Trebouxia sp. C0004]
MIPLTEEMLHLQREVAALRADLGVSERLRIAMNSNIIHTGKKGVQGQAAAVSMLLLRLDEELKKLKQARNTNEQRLMEAQGITRTVQAACQRLDREKQAVCELSQRQQQDCKLQLQWMQQHGEETLQQERLQYSQQVSQLQRELQQVAEGYQQETDMQVTQAQACLQEEVHTWERLCKAEQKRAAELQTGLQRAQQHILDLKEQHDLDLDASRRNHAAGAVKLRTHCCILETQLAQLRQQHVSQVASLEQHLQAKEAELDSFQSQIDVAGKAAELASSQQLSEMKALHEQAEQHWKQELDSQAKQHELEAAEVIARHERDHQAAIHSLKQQLQRLQTELSCQADCSQLEETIATFKSNEQQWRRQIAAVQADRDQMGRQHRVWGRSLAELLHWRRSGFSELRRVMQAWAALVSSPDHQVLQHGSGMAVAKACHLNRSQECAEEVNVKDGWRHHDRQLLGCGVRGWLCALRPTDASPLLKTAQPSLGVSRHALLSPSTPFALSDSCDNQQCDDLRLGALLGHRRTRSASPSLGSLPYGYAAQPAALWSSGAHESHRSIAPVRRATALASRTIKHRASSLVAAPALRSFTPTEGIGCCLCDLQGMQSVSGDPVHRIGQGCCKDCGYLSNSTEEDSTLTLPAYRPPAAAAAVSRGCLHHRQTVSDASSAAALGVSTVPVVPTTFLDHLASRKPSHGVSGSHDQMSDALLSGSGNVASGNQKLLSDVPDAASANDLKGAFGHCLQTSPVSEQHHAKVLHQQQQAEQQQQLGSDVRGRCSPAAANDSRQLALSSDASQAEAVSRKATQLVTAHTLQVQQQGIAAAAEQHVQAAKQQEQQPGLTKGDSSCSAAGHTSDRDWQLPQSISDQLQQARLSVTAIPRLTSSQPKPSPATPAVAEPLTVSTAAAEAPSASQTGTIAAERQLLVSHSGLAPPAQQAGQGQALEEAFGTARAQGQPRRTESLAQLRAIVAESHNGTRPQSTVQTDGQLYPGLCTQALPASFSHSRTAMTILPGLQSLFVTPVVSMSTDASSIAPDPHAPSNKEQHGNKSNVIQASSVRQKSYNGHCSSSIQSSQRQAHADEPASPALRRQTSCHKGCEQTQSTLVITCDQATEMATCVPMSLGDRRMLAHRYGMEQEEADWVLNEADASGSGSEGSVSSESNLRPSSVGRCRVNFGRHSKVALQSD